MGAARSIGDLPIRTTAADARRIAGDNEIDSDDFTGVELSYSIAIVNERREIELTLVWYSQELESNRSRGDTRFRSSEKFSLFNVNSCCPGHVIDEIQGIELSASGKREYRGEVHGYESFPATGSLKNIRVRFDGDGGQDQRQQSLTATLSGFTVKLRAAD